MKKIFAIALALVMVLSMASAFAANDCSTFDWTCPAKATNCGKGKVEVVPYVMVNDACEAVAYEVSTCASAINTQMVYYAVKLTVEANPDMNWWAEAVLEITAKGMMDNWSDERIVGLDVVAAGDAEFKNTKEQVWYLMKDGKTWINAADEDFDIANCIQLAQVKNAPKAKVCAKLTSKHSGVNTTGWKIGDYTVKVTEATATDANITITKAPNNSFTMSWKDGKVNKMEANSADFFNEVVAKFNLTGCVVGTCVDADIIQRNFGWDDKVESCFSWSDKGASVVNPECVVTLPKTGDASLLWWLF